MIPYVDGIEKNIGCAIANPRFNVLDLVIDLTFVGAGIATASGVYNLVTQPTQNANSGVLIGAGIAGMVTASIYHALVPIVTSQCRV